MAKKNFTVNYNREDDMLYVLASDLDYSNVEEGDYIEIRHNVTKKLLGYIVMNFTEHFNDKSIEKMPWREVNYKKDIKPKLQGD